MDFFSKLEKSLGNIIETALFAKPGGTIQPIEIARALWTEITAAKRSSLKDILIPNHYVVSLTSDDAEFLMPVRESVESEILKYIESESKKRDFKTLGPLVIQWEDDDSLKDGEFAVKLDFAGYEDLPGDLTQRKMTVSSQPQNVSVQQQPQAQSVAKPAKNIFEDTIVKPAPAVKVDSDLKTTSLKLDVVEGFDKGKIFRVSVFPVNIGRKDTNDISIGDPQVSGRHAVIKHENGKLIIEDLNSKTGLFVNGKRIERQVLGNGDEIGMGITKIKLFYT